jgi:hypothetical protein
MHVEIRAFTQPAYITITPLYFNFMHYNPTERQSDYDVFIRQHSTLFII